MKRRLLTGLLCCCLVFQTAASPVLAAEAAGYSADLSEEEVSDEAAAGDRLPDSHMQEEDQDAGQVPSEGESQEEDASDTLKGDEAKDGSSGDGQAEDNAVPSAGDSQEENGSAPGGDGSQGESGSVPAEEGSQEEGSTAPSEGDSQEESGPAPSGGGSQDDSTAPSEEGSQGEDNPAPSEEDSPNKDDVVSLPEDSQNEKETERPQEDISQLEEAALEQNGASSEQKEYTQDEVDALVSALPSMHVFINQSAALSNTLFQDLQYNASSKEGWSWKGADGLTLAASDTAPEQTYTAVYKKDGYKDLEIPVDVAISKINKITLSGDTYLTSSNDYQGSCRLTADITGSFVTDDELLEVLEITWASDKGAVKLLGEEQQLERALEAVDTGTDTVRAAVRLKGASTYKKNVTEFSVSYKITILEQSQSLADRFRIFISDRGTHATLDLNDYRQEEDASKSLTEISVDLDTLKESGMQTNMLDLEILAYEKDTELENASVKWSSTDAGVASVKMMDGQPVLLLKKKAGTAVITATAADKRKHAQIFTVRVQDYTPVVGTTSFTLNKFKEDGQDFTLLSINDNVIDSVNVLEYNGGTYEPSRLFDVDQQNDDENIWTVSFKDIREAEAIVKKKSYNCKLIMATEHGEYEKKVKITVEVTSPKATLKVVNKLNVFRLDESGRGAYSISSKYEIDKVTWTPYLEGSAEPYISGTYDPAAGRLYLSAQNVTKENYKQLLRTNYEGRKGKVTVSFKGFTESADYTFDKKADIVNKADAEYVVSDTTVYPGQGMIGRVLQVKEKDSGRRVIFGANDKVARVTKDTEVEIRNGNIELTYKGTASKTVKIKWTSPEYAQAVELSVKVNVIKDLEFNVPGTVYLNKQANNEAIVPLNVKGSDYPLDTFKWTSSALKKQVEEAKTISVQYNEDDQQLYIKLLKPEAFTKNTNYKVKLTGKVAEKVDVDDKEITLRVVTDEPTARMTGKGSINLLDREHTNMTYKPVLENVTDTVEDVELAGAGADYFIAEMDDDGNVLVYADENAPLKAKAKYQVRMNLTLASGCKVTSKAVTITPQEKKPKLKANMKKTTIYRYHPTDQVYQLDVTGSTYARIEDIRLVPAKKTGDFEYEYDDDGRGIVMLKEGNTVKKGTYSLSFHVYYEGMGLSSKPVTVKLSVAVK